MRAVLFLTAAVFTSSLTACQAGAPPPGRDEGTESPPSPRGAGAKGGTFGSPQQASAAGIKPLDKTKFGSAITESTTTPLPTIVKDPSSFANRTVRTEGMVSAVCQSAGCWMQIADTSGKAHIKMAGHSFFVPREAGGHRAVVQGKVLAANQPNACGSDGCGNQEVTQIEIEATGVEFID